MFGNHWPTHAHDWADLLAQQELQREVVGQVLGEFSDEAQNCTEKAIQRVRREFWTTWERRFAELNARIDVMVKGTESRAEPRRSSKSFVAPRVELMSIDRHQFPCWTCTRPEAVDVRHFLGSCSEEDLERHLSLLGHPLNAAM
jgi:hypothetical protein